MNVTNSTEELIQMLDNLQKEIEYRNGVIADLEAKEEMLKAALVARLCPTHTEGTLYVVYGAQRLKVVRNITRSLDRDVYKRLINANHYTTQEEKRAMQLASSVVALRPEVRVSAWKALTSADRTLLRDLVTEKPGALHVSLVPSGDKSAASTLPPQDAT